MKVGEKMNAGEPKRLATFYSESSKIRDAAEKLSAHAGELAGLLSDRKRFGRVPVGFEQAWAEYFAQWAPAIAHGVLRDLFEGTRIKIGLYDPDRPSFRGSQIHERQEPDPEDDDKFIPQRHDGGSALKLGVDYWRSECGAYAERVRSGEYEAYDRRTAKQCRIALDAFDYLTHIIGVDIDGIFRRWNEVPFILMPAAVSNKHGEEKGSLNELLDSAVRAYVCGAPAAAIALCRAILEMIIKSHYVTDPKDRTRVDGSGKVRDKGLGELIVTAEKRYGFRRTGLRRADLNQLKFAGDAILHPDGSLSPADEKLVIEYMLTLKTLIQKVMG
jgi:hypothetical protein